MSSEFSAVTRLEIIDHTGCESCSGTGIVLIATQSKPLECPACHGMGMGGREVVFFDSSKKIELSLQDDNRTLKVFINKREAK